MLNIHLGHSNKDSPKLDATLRFIGKWYKRDSMGGWVQFPFEISRKLLLFEVSSSLTFQVASTQTIPKACIGLTHQLSPSQLSPVSSTKTKICKRLENFKVDWRDSLANIHETGICHTNIHIRVCIYIYTYC